MGVWVAVVAAGLLAADPQEGWTEAKRAAVAAVDRQRDQMTQWGQRIWEYAEPAFQEFESSKLLADVLENNGFRVTRGVAGMKTAFVAEAGSGKPVIAVLAEFDALPGLNQEAVPRKEPRPRATAGHGCGHNLFGAASTAAAIAVNQVLKEKNIPGTVRLYGCPAEEGGGGKVYMVRDGLFKDVDVALHWHPADKNSAALRTCLAVIRFRARYYGKSAHAAGSPHEGRSAMDGVELFNVGMNYMREHIIQQARVHYVVTNGGLRPNVVPDYAEVWYYIRAPKMTQAREIFERAKKVAQGAALMSETRHEIVEVTGTYELLLNETLGKLMDKNLNLIGPPKFSEEEMEFARQLRQSLGLAEDMDLTSGASGPIHTAIEPFQVSLGYGSTDVGDVSWTVPTVGLNIATAARGIPGHSWSFVACSGSPIGHRGAHTAAQVLACTAVDILQQPDLIEKAKQEFQKRRAGAEYENLIGDAVPPDKL